MAAYLFAHFIGDHEGGEQIYFSISKDGLHWNDLNYGNPVLCSGIGERGVRDPFLVKDEEKQKYYLIATDLCIAAGKGWHAAQYDGSRDLIVWESEDLIHWSDERQITIGVEGAGCVWAPEAVYDKGKKAFFVFFASMVCEENPEKNQENSEWKKINKNEIDSRIEKEAIDTERYKQIIFGTYTKDFKTFTKAEKYIERDNHVIDTTIVYDNGKYYRFSKDETTKRIQLDCCESLHGKFTTIKSKVLDELEGVEGPECFLLPDGKTWCLIVDRYATGRGYIPLVTTDLSKGEFRILATDEYDLGRCRKRHGGIISISDEEYERLFEIYASDNPVILE